MDLYTAAICYLVFGFYMSLLIYWHASRSGEDLINPLMSVLLVIVHAMIWPITLYFVIADAINE